ncbi:peptidylprolyl isomerase [Paracoccaceae bacterium Fryx2]|nr:peptidylprolyl isomerase [Paracoccaceae bacterium Fryx2]
MPQMMRLVTFLSVGLMLSITAMGAPAQTNQFAPRMIVNDRVITGYELSQRERFLTLLRAPGDVSALALKALIDDKLRMSAAKQMGIALTAQQLTAGMNEFAGRANLTGEQFVAALAQGGVDAETFRDFVAAGFLWREVVRAKFGPLTRITDVEVDRGLTNAVQGLSMQVLLSEIVLAAPAGKQDAAMARMRQLRARIKTEADFAAAARQYSSGPTAGSGGQLDWQQITDLPASLAPVLIGMGQGNFTPPVQEKTGVRLYLLRGIREGTQDRATSSVLDYAMLMLPGDDGSQAARVLASVDACNDLYGQALGLPEGQLQRQTLPQGQVPGDIAAELAKLDEGESSTALVRGGSRVFLMLCSRRPGLAIPPTREMMRNQLTNQRLAMQAEIYMEELRSEAIIREP